jgi:hypothetical protein
MVEVSKLYHQVYKHVLGEIMAGRLAPIPCVKPTWPRF